MNSIITSAFYLKTISRLWPWRRNPSRNQWLQWVEEKETGVQENWGNWQLQGTIPKIRELCRKRALWILLMSSFKSLWLSCICTGWNFLQARLRKLRKQNKTKKNTVRFKGEQFQELIQGSEIFKFKPARVKGFTE